MRKRLFVFFSIVLAAVMLAGCGKKEFKVTFDVDGGTPAVTEQLVKKGELADVPTPEPTKDGFTFEGWFLEETQWRFSEDKVTKAITLVAKWKEKSDPVVETVKIVFDARGGTPAPGMQEIEKGKKAVKPVVDPELDGHTFIGWHLDGELFDFNTAIQNNVTLVAQYVETETVNVTFVAGGGEPAPDNVTIEKGTALPEPAEMTLDKHEFLGWFLNDELYNFELPVDNHIVLIAKWERIYETYTVTFDIGYEESDEVFEPQLVQEEDYATEPQVEDRFGYRFLGWFDGEDKFEFTSIVIKDLDLVARWEEEFVVSFDINYDEGEDVASQLILKNEKANNPPIANREFYNFEGWFVDGEGEAFDFDTPITGNLHLVGKWTELQTYNINYHNVTDNMFVYGTKEAMVEAYLTDFYNFVDSGFALEPFMHGVGKTEGFDGLWVEAQASIYNGAEPNLNKPDNQFFAYSEEYMAKWKPFHDMMHEFVVAVNPTQFFYGSGTWTGFIRLREYIIDMPERAPHIEMMPDPLIQNTPVKVHLGDEEVELLAPYRNDAAFLGWYDNAEFTGEPITVIPAGTEADFDVYAKWDEVDRYDVTFDIGYAEGMSPEAQEVLEGHKAVEPAEPARRPGHRFQGWFLEGAENAFDFDTPITAAITLVAKWNEVNEAKVTFDYDTTGVEDLVEWVIVDSTISEPVEPVKENHRFLGWFDGEAEFDFSSPITAEITLVAKWESLDVFTITYTHAGGTLFDGFATREEMLDEFLTDFYTWLEAEGHLNSAEVSLSDFIHGPDKTSGYDGLYVDVQNEDNSYFQKLYTVVDSVPIKELAPETGSFINQLAYNAKWLPFMDLVDEFSQLADDAGFWKSKYIGFRRLKEFIQGKNLWLNKAEEAAIILATIPNEYAVPRYEYNIDDETFYLPQAMHETKEFNGWYDNPEFAGEPIVKVVKGSTGNLDLYANFGVPLQRFEVQYKLGYEELTLDSKMVVEGQKVVKPEDPVRHLFAFTGWVLEGGTDLFDFENTIITGNIVLVATWDALAPMTVSFDLGYVDSPAMADVIVGEGTMVLRPETDPTRSEYVFLGWFLNDVEYDFNTPVTADITLVAKWEAAPHTLIYNLDGGVLANADLVKLYSQESFVATRFHKTDSYVAGDRLTLARYGRMYNYAIGFVETEISGLYKVIGSGNGYNDPNGDLFLRAHEDLKKEDGGEEVFNRFSTLIDSVVVGELFYIGDLPDASAAPVAIDAVYLGNLDLEAVPVVELNEFENLLTPIKDKFNFMGWYDNAEFTGEALTELPTTLEDDLNLYAKWEAKVYHTVTFDTDGGIAIDPLEVETGHVAAEPATPVKEGFVFLGWNLGTEPYDFTELVTEDITLIAQWRALEEYTVTFDFDTDGVENLVGDVVEGQKVTKPANPLKDGHVFDGWFLGEATEPFDFETEITENIVLVARWTATETVTVSFDLKYEGAEEMDDVVIAKGAKVNEPVEPTREGYVFLGWFVQLETEVYDFDLEVDVDLALEARWDEIIVSTITYNVDGGVFYKYGSREEMVDDLIADLKIVGNRTQDRIKDMADPTISAFFADANLQVKWGWLINHIIDLAVTSNHPSKDKLISKDPAIWRWTLDTFTVKEHRTGWPGDTLDFSIEENNNAFWDDMPTGEPVGTYTEGQEHVLEVPVKEGFTFKGWYDNLEFIGTPITKITTIDTGNLTLYAKWIKIMTIAEALAEVDDTEVAFVGVVTGFTEYSSSFSNYDKVWLEDATGAITVYRGKFPETLAIGDKYQVIGERASFRELKQVTSVSTLELLSSEHALIDSLDAVPVDLIVADQGKRVNMEAVVVLVSSGGKDMMVKVGETEILVRPNSSSGLINDYLLTLEPGFKVNLVNIHVDWSNGAQLLPTQIEQIVLIPFTDEEEAVFVENELKDLFNDKEFDMETEIHLPVSRLDVSISWEMDPIDAISEGKWKIVAADTEVTLTATLIIGVEERIVILNALIKYIDPNVVPDTTVTAEVVIVGNPKNMDENIDYAAHANLSELFTVNGFKGSAGQNVGLYDGAFRMYSVRASGDGNTLKISIAAGYEIKNIKINYATGGAATTADLDLGGTVQNISALKGGSQDYTDLAVSYFSIKNTHEGGSKNLQIHIESIEITYNTV